MGSAFGIEQSRLLDAGVLHFAGSEILERASKEGLVLLEEDLQKRSLQRLHQISLTKEEVEVFRETFSRLP